MLWKDAPQTLGSDENFFLTPIFVQNFVQNFNHLSYLQRLLRWLLAAGYKNICVIDNHSSYRPLLQFYEEIESRSGVNVVRRNKNGSRTTLWEEQLLDRFALTGPFVYTDSDVVPDESCPSDMLARLAGLLRDYPQIFKAGLGLRIDNLPPSYRFRDEAVEWEKQFWRAPVCPGAFLSKIDTTFALYRPKSAFAMGPALRTGWPYLARHETWYQNSANLSDEQRYYRSEVEKTGRGHWSRKQLPQCLKEETVKRTNSQLQLLHLRCGHQSLPGWINLDRVAASGADIVFDFEAGGEKRLPLATDSIDGFLMCHAVQRIGAIAPMMQELHRVAKAGARFIIRLSDDGSGAAFADAMKKRIASMMQELHRVAEAGIRFIIRLSHGGSGTAFADATTKRSHFPGHLMRRLQPAAANGGDDAMADWIVTRVKLVVDQDLVGVLDESQILKRIGRKPSTMREMIVELRAVKPPRLWRDRSFECPAPTISGTAFDPESDFNSRSPA
jgi:SAM-dependent methyltransferase